MSSSVDTLKTDLKTAFTKFYQEVSPCWVPKTLVTDIETGVIQKPPLNGSDLPLDDGLIGSGYLESKIESIKALNKLTNETMNEYQP